MSAIESKSANGRLAGKVAVVTGAARNLGSHIAAALAREGASVVAHTGGSGEVDSVVKAIADTGGRAIAVRGRLDAETTAVEIMRAACDKFGGIDILVNNVAIRRAGNLDSISLQDWREMFAVNLEAPFLCSKAALPSLRKRGGGSIVNITGVVAYAPMKDRLHVAASKAGLAGLTKAMAIDLASDNIRVNAISPGFIDGPSTPPAAKESVPLNRLPTGIEIADLVVFLCGPAGAAITGQTIHVNGGSYLS
jgi:3-oxoacyl-[acyl-carrier protein] reductase